MNADDRATQPTTDAEAPASPVTPASGTSPQRTTLRSGQMPTRAPFTGGTPVTGAGANGAPTSSPAPASSPFAPQSGATTFPARPTTGAQPVSAPQEPAAPSTPAEDESTSAFGRGLGRIKSAAANAKEEIASADPIAASKKKGGPRKVRVLVSRIDPWSALKIGFLLSIAIGIMMVVAMYVLWNVLDSMGTWVLINEWVLRLFPENTDLDLLQFVELPKVMSATTLIAVVNVVLLTALATIGAFLYNVVSAVVGGFYVTLTDD